MNPNLKNLVNPILFWFHLLFIFSAVAVGFFFSPIVVIAMVIIHRIHTIIFRECVLSKFQKRLKGLPDNVNFLQFAVKKFFQKDITSIQSRILDYSLASLAIIIAFAK